MNTTERARAYLVKLSPAVAGHGGHAATLAAACRLVEFGLNEPEAWEIFCDWNLTHCQPHWTERDLRHKLTDAYKLTSAKPRFATPDAYHGAPEWTGRALGHAAKSPVLPALCPGTPSQLARLAGLRGLSREGVTLASQKGLLRFGALREHPAWFICDGSGRTAQARRCDGAPWADGVKAWTLRHSQAAWLVGIGEAGGFPVLALCEGGPDLLAACAFILAEGRENDVAPVAMLGGCARIHPDALPLCAGKRVRIFRHADATGEEAADRWSGQLAEAGAEVDAFKLNGLARVDGLPVKDLCDLAAINADDFEANRCLWNLFPYALAI